MFIITMGRKGMKKAIIIAAGCVLLVVTTVVGGFIFAGNGEATPAMAQAQRMQDTTVVDIEDVSLLLTSFGVEIDVTSAELSKVSVPDSFDDQFVEFNDILKDSGGDLSGLKGDTVDRWKVLCTNRGMKDETVYAVILVRGNTPVGCYLLCEPSGEVQSVADLSEVMLEVQDETEQVMGEVTPPVTTGEVEVVVS